MTPWLRDGTCPRPARSTADDDQLSPRSAPRPTQDPDVPRFSGREFAPQRAGNRRAIERAVTRCTSAVPRRSRRRRWKVRRLDVTAHALVLRLYLVTAALVLVMASPGWPSRPRLSSRAAGAARRRERGRGPQLLGAAGRRPRAGRGAGADGLTGLAAGRLPTGRTPDAVSAKVSALPDQVPPWSSAAARPVRCPFRPSCGSFA